MKLVDVSSRKEEEDPASKPKKTARANKRRKGG
jgi:hypothetical protein